jgi:hypothetical protein
VQRFIYALSLTVAILLIATVILNYKENFDMKSKLVFNIFSAIILLALTLTTFGVIPASAAVADAQPMLKFKSGNHMLGFTSSGMYAATTSNALRVNFLNANQTQPQADSNAEIFTRVNYPNLWDGIALEYSAAKNGVYTTTYTLVPRANVNQIQLQYNAPISLNKNGSLAIAFKSTLLTESAPIAWQVINGKRISVDVAYRVNGQKLAFELGAYDPRYSLIIDPVLTWTYTTTWEEPIEAMAVDSNENIYVTGTGIGSNVIVKKLSSAGALVWSVTYNGPSIDAGTAIATDGTYVYVTGYSAGSMAVSPIVNHSGGNSDIFVLKLNASNGSRVWFTYYGGIRDDHGNAIALDGSGNIYIGGFSTTAWSGQPPVHAHWGGGPTWIFLY